MSVVGQLRAWTVARWSSWRLRSSVVEQLSNGASQQLDIGKIAQWSSVADDLSSSDQFQQLHSQALLRPTAYYLLPAT